MQVRPVFVVLVPDRHPPNMDHRPVEVEAVQPKADALTPAKACATGQGDNPAVATRDHREQLPKWVLHG